MTTKDHNDVVVVADKEGFLEFLKPSKDPNNPKKKDEWVKYYFKLFGGSLYFYEKEKAKKAKGLLQLKDIQVAEANKEKKFLITLSAGGQTFTIAAPDQKSSTEWANSFKANTNKATVNLQLKGEASNSGILFKAKKNIAGKAASSGLGKTVMKKVIDDEIKQLLTCIKNIIAVEGGSKEYADKLERNTIKITVKAYFLWENKTIPIEEFLKIETPLKQALRILIAVFDHIEKVKDPSMRAGILDEKFTVVAVLLDTVKDSLVKLLSPHLSAKSMNRVQETFETIARRDFLLNSYNNESLRPDLTHAINFGRNYIKS
jgi:hypothetical protein